MLNPMNRLLSLILALAFSAVLFAQSNVPPTTQEAEQDSEQGRFGYLAPALDAYQGAWNLTDGQRSADLWRALCDSRPADVGAQLNWFRSERNVRLGQNNGRLLDDDKAQLDEIAERIANTAPGSFEQHLSNYFLRFPEPAAFTALEQASVLDAERQELILPMLNRALVNGDLPAVDKWCLQVTARGALSPALTDVAKDLFRSVDKDGVVFTNGDMDAVPAVVLQRLQDQRRDVLIVDQRLLAHPHYRERVWKASKAGGPVPGAGPGFAKALKGASSRPVFLALSLDRSWFDAFPGGLSPSGIAFEVMPARSTRTTAELDERWTGMTKTLLAGPLSRNYLLPGAVLLRRLRSEGNERRAAQVEHELRILSKSLGATTELINAGVLAH